MTKKARNYSNPAAFSRIAIGIGSNLGDSVTLVAEAVEQLLQDGVKQLRLSSFYETVPVDCAPGTPLFVNAVVVGLYGGSCRQLLNLCHAIEHRLGRPFPHRSDESRRIDLDLLLFDETVFTEPDLRIPHPQLRHRFFVLVPLREVAGNWTVPPDGSTVAELFEALAAIHPEELVGIRKIN